MFFNFSPKNIGKKSIEKKTNFLNQNFLLQKGIKKDTLQPKHQSASMGKDPSRLIPDKMEARRDSIRLFAEQFLGTRYAWGGTQPGGFDCSGYALYIFNNFGYKIPRMSGDQVLLGDFVSEKDAQTGDLAYYGYPYGKGYIYTHTAIVHSNSKKNGVWVIHAILSGVAITGIHFDPNYTQKLVCIKRIVK